MRPGLDVRLAVLRAEHAAAWLTCSRPVGAPSGGDRHPVAAGRRLPRPHRHPRPNRRLRNRRAVIAVRQADVLGEDDRLVSVLRRAAGGAGRHPARRPARCAGGGDRLVGSGGQRTHRPGRAKADGSTPAGRARRPRSRPRPEPSLTEAADRLRRRGARGWSSRRGFWRPGRLPDRVRSFAQDAGIPMAEPLGAHRPVAETVLDRFDQALKLEPSLAA